MVIKSNPFHPSLGPTILSLFIFLYFPLSKDYCLRIQPSVLEEDDTDLVVETCTEEELVAVNRLILSTKYHMAIGSDKKMLEQSLDA